jgi:hypothetical protein
MRIYKGKWLNIAFSLFTIGLILIAGGCGVSVAGSVLAASDTVQFAQAETPEVKRIATSEARKQQRRVERRQRRRLRRQQGDGQLRIRRHERRTLGGNQIYGVRKKQRTQRRERRRHRELRRQQQFGPPLTKRQRPILTDRSQKQQFKKLCRAQRRERRLERKLRRLEQPVTPRIRHYGRRKDGSGQHKFRRRKRHDRRHRHRRHPNIYLEPYPYWDYVPPVYGKLSCEAARQKVIRRGFHGVRAYDCVGNVYGFRARKNGRRYKIRVSAIHGNIISLVQY